MYQYGERVHVKYSIFPTCHLHDASDITVSNVPPFATCITFQHVCVVLFFFFFKAYGQILKYLSNRLIAPGMSCREFISQSIWEISFQHGKDQHVNEHATRKILILSTHWLWKRESRAEPGHGGGGWHQKGWGLVACSEIQVSDQSPACVDLTASVSEM